MLLIWIKMSSKTFSLPIDGGLLENSLPYGILHSYERIPVEVSADAIQASKAVADIIVAEINSHPDGFRLGVTTGKTPITLYHELAERCSSGNVAIHDDVVFQHIDAARELGMAEHQAVEVFVKLF